jgi:hypothetical protein
VPEVSDPGPVTVTAPPPIVTPPTLLVPHAAVAKMRDSQAMSARCLEFIALTATRLTEARAARWTEFDFEKAVWSIPVVRMKMRNRLQLREPLSFHCQLRR